MKCEFIKPGDNAFGVTCKRAQALKQVSVSVEGVMSPQELMGELCQNDNAVAREQCPAYVDILEHGAGSGWVRK